MKPRIMPGSRRVAPMLFGALVCILAPTAAARSAQQTPKETAVEAHARILARLRAIEDAQMATVEAQDGREDFVLTGVADEATQRWLDLARPLAREITGAAALPYARNLDYGQGFSLLLPHLAQQRFLVRASRYLAHDAAFRGDRALVGELLRAQVTTAKQAGQDRLLISSLVSMGIMAMHASGVDDFLDRGAIDRSAAQALLDSRAGLESSMRAQLLAAVGTEAEMAVQEAGKLAELGDAARRAQLQAFGVPDAEALDLASVAKWKEQSNAYRDAVKQALANPDPAAVKTALAEIETRAEQGAFGDLVKAFAPALVAALGRLDVFAPTLAAQDARLAELASGAKKPEDFLNAAHLYLAASRAAEKLAVEQQLLIESVRMASDDMSEDDRREARRALERLRAGVIDRVIAASKIKRCEFRDSGRAVPDLVPAGSEGALGALRIALSDALLPGDRPAGSASAADACIAAVVAVRHFAEGGGLGHALMAQRFARDVAAALAAIEARHQLDAGARERLGAELSRLTPTDPFGLRRAVDFERARLAGMSQPPRSTRSEGTPFSRERLGALSPDSIAFLVATVTAARPALAPGPCGCPFDGPILDIRGFFDLDALKAAQAQGDKLRQRFDRLVLKGDEGGGSALHGLTATKPVDVAARLDEAVADFERLQAFSSAKPPAPSAAP